nr:MAG TPA: hypothetical protein [Bacteriophage sp.]
MFKRFADRIKNTYNNVRTRVSNLFRQRRRYAILCSSQVSKPKASHKPPMSKVNSVNPYSTKPNTHKKS